MVGRELLLDAAFDALLEEGPAFPVSSVARRADASKALVFHHFGARDALLDAMAARVLAETQEGLTRLALDYPNPRDRIDALARTLLEDPRSPPEHARRVLQFWLDADAAGAPRGALRDALLTDFVRATLAEAGPRAADPGPIAGTLLARWHGVTTLHATGARVDFEREADRLVEDVRAMWR